MEIRLARILSYLLHPVLLPTFTYLLLLYEGSFIPYILPDKLKWGIIGFVFLISAFIPVLVNYILLRQGIIKSMEMETRQERLIPFLVTAFCFYLTAYMASSLQIPAVFYLFSLGITMLVLLALFLTLYIKVSIHMVGIGGMTATFLGLSIHWKVDMLWIILLLFLLSGLVGYARLRLGTHKTEEIYSGYLLGFGVMLLLFLLI
ncbi:MAG: hypothetical protein NTU44_07750 [Bacteroidetes bacterium]|nr:hypothetical protein [Bacteroidota bacterium]